MSKFRSATSTTELWQGRVKLIEALAGAWKVGFILPSTFLLSSVSDLSRPQKFVTRPSSSERACFSLKRLCLKDPKRICPPH